MLTLNNLVANFNMALAPPASAAALDDVDEVESKVVVDSSAQQVIPLCVTDLLENLLLSKVDQTVEKYLSKVHRCLESSEDFCAVLETEVTQTRMQIEQAGLSKDSSDSYVDKCMDGLSEGMPATLYRYLELAQATETEFSIETFCNDFIGFVMKQGGEISGRRLSEETVRGLFDPFRTIYI